MASGEAPLPAALRRLRRLLLPLRAGRIAGPEKTTTPREGKSSSCSGFLRRRACPREVPKFSRQKVARREPISGSSRDSGIIVRVREGLGTPFCVSKVFRGEFSPVIWAVGDGSPLQCPGTRSGRLILLRVLLGGDIHYTRVCKVVPFRARNGRCGGSLPDNFPGIIRSSPSFLPLFVFSSL